MKINKFKNLEDFLKTICRSQTPFKHSKEDSKVVFDIALIKTYPEAYTTIFSSYSKKAKVNNQILNNVFFEYKHVTYGLDNSEEEDLAKSIIKNTNTELEKSVADITVKGNAHNLVNGNRVIYSLDYAKHFNL